MTTLQLPAPPTQAIHSAQKRPRRPLQSRWHYGRAYLVIAAIAPLVMLGLLLLHVHTLSQHWLNGLRGFSISRARL